MVKSCILCKNLRGTPLHQLVVNLPRKRVKEVAPFVNAGMDVFGLYTIMDGRETQRYATYWKVWVLIVVCLPSSAVHLEPLPLKTLLHS